MMCTCANKRYNEPCKLCRFKREQRLAEEEQKKKDKVVFTWDEASVLI